MVLLIDNDLNSKDSKQVSESLRSVVAGLSLNDEAFICRFDQRFHEGKGFLSDQDKLLTELKRTRLDGEPPRGLRARPLPIVRRSTGTPPLEMRRILPALR